MRLTLWNERTLTLPIVKVTGSCEISRRTSVDGSAEPGLLTWATGVVGGLLGPGHARVILGRDWRGPEPVIADRWERPSPPNDPLSDGS